MLELARYVVLNPVRARMVNDVQEWQWSSYPAITGRQAAPEWLETNWILSYFGKYRGERIARYKDYVRAGVGLPPVWENLRHQVFLGEEGFVDEIQEKYRKPQK